MKQSRIDIEADAGVILRGLATFEQLSRKAVASDHDAFAAVKWLIGKHYAHWGVDGYLRISGRGRDHYEALCRNPAVTASPTAWKEEVRSGMKTVLGPLGTVTRRSEIDRACIPSPSPPRTPLSPESIVAQNESMTAARDQWLAKFGCTEDELYQFGMEGRLRYCEGCEDVGVFDRDRGGWRSLCRECRKTNRQQTRENSSAPRGDG